MDKLISISILLAMLRIATPLVLAALGGIFSEKSGVVNIGLEGMMLMGAFTSVAVTYYTEDPWIGTLAAMFVGGLMGLLLAFVCVTLRANQIVAGTALNILAAGFSVFFLRMIFEVEGTSPAVPTLPKWGPFNPIVYITVFLVILSWVVINKTKFGLRIRAVGEHPHAVDSVGISVYKLRYTAVIISGIFASLAGVHLSIGENAVFVKNMTAGRGFIGLAAMIFGNWDPLRSFGAACIFGYAEAIQTTLKGTEIFGMQIPTQLLSMIPYVVTLVVLAGFIGKSTPPAASGVEFKK